MNERIMEQLAKTELMSLLGEEDIFQRTSLLWTTKQTWVVIFRQAFRQTLGITSNKNGQKTPDSFPWKLVMANSGQAYCVDFLISQNSQ